jgi:site-specific DNA-cytosine methylase
MRLLRKQLEEQTNEKWSLHHVLHNAASVGGAAIRKRYFWVVSRVPFGVEPPEIKRVPELKDVIGDLEGLGLTWEPQPYRRPASWWVEEQNLRSESGLVDCHYGRFTSVHSQRVTDLMSKGRWAQGEIVSTVAQRYYETHGELPLSWAAVQEKLVAKDWQMGFHQPTRWRRHRVARVVTGAALDQIIHPTEHRLMTHREIARIQGFPDDWTIRTSPDRHRLGPTWGKGIPVQCGRWIGGWLKAAVEGEPGSYAGEPSEERDEYVINFTSAHKAVCNEN